MPKKSDRAAPETPVTIKSRKQTAKLSGTPASPAATPGKRTTAKATRTPSRQKVAAASKVPPRPAFEDIQLRAYFVAEQRRREGRPGDEHQDWIEAERQLVAERPSKPRQPEKAVARRRKNTDT